MKIKAACIGTSQEVADAFSGSVFASDVLSAVVGGDLGVENVLDRPAEYYVQSADVGPAPKPGVMGVEVRLTGVSRDGRKSKRFHDAMRTLVTIVGKTAAQALPVPSRCQIFCVIMLDGEVETAPGSGVYSCNLESSSWITTEA